MRPVKLADSMQLNSIEEESGESRESKSDHPSAADLRRDRHDTSQSLSERHSRNSSLVLEMAEKQDKHGNDSYSVKSAQPIASQGIMIK